MENDIPNYYTAFDKRHAGIYARYRINMDKCNNPEFKAAYPGTEWVPNKGLQTINCPAGLSKCNDVFGRCKITTKEQCLEQSGDYREAGVGSTPYLEWRDDLDNGQGQGQCIFGNFMLRNYCENPASRRSGNVAGVTDVPPFHYDVDSSSCQVSKDYCKYMGVGFTPSNKEGLPDCHEGWWQKQAEKFFGRTLVRGLKSGKFNKFAWDIIKMGLTTPGPIAYYEIYKGIESGKYRDELGLDRQNTKPPEREDFTPENPGYSEYSGNPGFVDFLKKIKNDIEKNMKIEMEKIKKEHSSGEEPPIVKGLIDENCIDEKVLIKSDFGGNGIGLYLIKWKIDVVNLELVDIPIQLGFISKEIEKEYPQLVRKIDKKKYIIILPELTKNDRYIRRLYHAYSNPKSFFRFIGNIISIDNNIKNIFSENSINKQK